LERQSKNIEQEIEAYFLAELGIEKTQKREIKKGLQFVEFKDLERWDVFSTDVRITQELKKSKFKIVSIGEIFKFAKRSFNKNTYKNKTFNYIEIGAIDPLSGILFTKEITTKNAPSRATQIVKKGDLIIATTRPYLKKFAIVSNKYDDNICSSGFSVIKQSDNYNLLFLQQFLNCFYGIEQLKNNMTGGLYPAITEEELTKIKIPLPPLHKQQEIVNVIQAKKETIKNIQTEAKNLKQEAEREFERKVFSDQ